VQQFQRGGAYDPAEVHKLLQKLQARPNCVMEYDTDGDGRLTRLFWMYEEQVCATKAWGDVVLQDNTCKTNIYGLPFAAFVGVDGNGR
jgi:hypothetical protein